MSDAEKFAEVIAKSTGQDAAWAVRVAEQLSGLWQGADGEDASKQRNCCGGAHVDYSPPAS